MPSRYEMALLEPVSPVIGPRKYPLLNVYPDNIKPYNILILFISLAYLAITLDVTGILQATASWVINKGGSSSRRHHIYFYALLTLMGMVVGNVLAVPSGAVFTVYYTAETGLPPDAWLISGFVAANAASMVLFVGNPTNIVICEGFRISNTAYSAYTILPSIACSITGCLVLMLQYKLPSSGSEIKARERLRVGRGAIFGTIWVTVCLIVVIILGFLHMDVDVWKIVLPFAGGKCIFDICWDHHRYSTGNIRRSRDNGTDGVGCAEEGSSEAATLNDHDTTPLPRTIINTLGNEFQRSISPLPSTTTLPSHHNNPTPEPRRRLVLKYEELASHFPTFFTVLPQLPFGLVSFAFSQFILVEALEHQGWIDIFARWLVIASNKQVVPVIWLVGLFGVILCNIAGTNIGATILLTKIIMASHFPESAATAAAVSLAVASNIGAVSFTFSASLSGLFWVSILEDKGIKISQRKFAMSNILPLVAMTGAGLGVVSGMMLVLY
jgi:Na+/H+ antiporter NhaD/arsenite permease-like protein